MSGVRSKGFFWIAADPRVAYEWAHLRLGNTFVVYRLPHVA